MLIMCEHALKHKAPTYPGYKLLSNVQLQLKYVTLKHMRLMSQLDHPRFLVRSIGC